MGKAPRQTGNSGGMSRRLARPHPRAMPPRGDGTAAHAAPATSSPGWSEVAVATITYVIHPARLQVWGGNCAIFEVSLGSFLISSVAWSQRSRPGHAPGTGTEEGTGQGWPGQGQGRAGTTERGTTEGSGGGTVTTRGRDNPGRGQGRAAAVMSEGSDSSCAEGQFGLPAWGHSPWGHSPWGHSPCP